MKGNTARKLGSKTDGKAALKNALLRRLPAGAVGTQSHWVQEPASSTRLSHPPEGQDCWDVCMPMLTCRSLMATLGGCQVPGTHGPLCEGRSASGRALDIQTRVAGSQCLVLKQDTNGICYIQHFSISCGHGTPPPLFLNT